MATELQLPHFLGIGAVKAGTTWLHRNLYAHPALYVPAQKPVYFWDRHRSKGLESYARIFRPGRDRICGEFTASYSVLGPEIKHEIRELMPNLKLILVLREPRERAWSEARMELTMVQGHDVHTLTEADYLEFIRSAKCRARGDYPSIIRAWTACFPRDQLYVGLYDDIRDHPQRFLGEVFGFLEVPVPDDWSNYPFAKRIFEGSEIEIPSRCRAALEEMYQKPVIEEAAELCGLDLVSAWGIYR